MRAWSLALLATLAQTGCVLSVHHEEDAGGDGDVDGDVDGDIDGDIDGDVDGDADGDGYCLYAELHQTESTPVDILFVVDDSSSMMEEQTVLADQMELMARELIHPSPGASGEAPPAVEDLHVGVVSTDMGTGGYTVMTCANPLSGDGGLLQSIGRSDGCTPTYSALGCDRAECPWLAHSRALPDDGSDPSDAPIWEDFGCIAPLGTEGCGFEQPFESALQALTVESAPGGANEGFLREGSLLAIVFVTDEDDCSAQSPELFNPSRDDLGPMNTRCARNDALLYDVSRYHDGFLGLREGRDDRLVVAAITGVPIDGSWVPGDSLDALRALAVVDPGNPNELLPTCETPMGRASAPVRIAELVYSFGDSGVMESICRADWSSALEAITRKVQSRLTGACLERPLPSAEIGVCRVVETLSDDRPCPHPVVGPEGGRSEGWHRDLGLDGEGRRECEVLPSDYDVDGCPDGPCDCDSEEHEGCLQGWYYRQGGDLCEAGQVLLSSASVVEATSHLRIECPGPCGY